MAAIYSTAQICKSGHKITADYEGSPESRQNFCSECSMETITKCQNCKAPIHGYFKTLLAPDIAKISDTHYPVPSYCHNCGKPYPWAQERLEEAKEFIDSTDELDDEDKEILKKSLPDIAEDNLKTKSASENVRKIASKVSPPLGKRILDFAMAIATAGAKKWMGY